MPLMIFSIHGNCSALFDVIYCFTLKYSYCACVAQLAERDWQAGKCQDFEFVYHSKHLLTGIFHAQRTSLAAANTEYLDAKAVIQPKYLFGLSRCLNHVYCHHHTSTRAHSPFKLGNPRHYCRCVYTIQSAAFQITKSVCPISRGKCKDLPFISSKHKNAGKKRDEWTYTLCLRLPNPDVFPSTPATQTLHLQGLLHSRPATETNPQRKHWIIHSFHFNIKAQHRLCVDMMISDYFSPCSIRCFVGCFTCWTTLLPTTSLMRSNRKCGRPTS